MKKKIICFDIDNTLCKTKGIDYKKSRPFKKKIDFINSLKKKGFYIKIFTARFMGRNNDNQRLAKKAGFNFTKKQLRKWGLVYDELIFGKPTFDILIDDKSLNYHNKWVYDLEKKLNLLK